MNNNAAKKRMPVTIAERKNLYHYMSVAPGVFKLPPSQLHSLSLSSTTYTSALTRGGRGLLDISPLSELFENLVWDINFCRNVNSCNPPFKNLMGAPGKVSAMFWWLRRIHPGDQRRIFTRMKHAIQSQTNQWEEVYRFRNKKGQYIFIQDKVHASYGNDQLQRITVLFKDISKVKELELQLNIEKLNRQQKISEAVIKGIEKERTRLGQELHDNVNQILSCAKLYVDQLHPHSKTEKDAKQKGIELILLAIEEIRNLSKDLVLPQINGRNIIGHMEKLIGHIRVVGGIEVEFIHHLEGRQLTAGKATSLFRIFQEQLKNILVHSKATKVTVNFTTSCKDIRLTVSDNGVGANQKPNGGIGLSNIRERVIFYNGNFSVHTHPGEGFSTEIIIPRSRRVGDNSECMRNKT